MKLRSLYENRLSRCDACQRKNNNLRKVPEIPSLKFCPPCHRNRVEILLKAREDFSPRLLESTFDKQDENWKEFFQNLNPDDIDKLKQILASKKGYWQERQKSRKNEDEINYDPADYWKLEGETEPEEDVPKFSDEIDLYNQKAQANIDRQNQEKAERQQKQKNQQENIEDFRDHVWDELIRSIQRRYPGKFVLTDTHKKPCIFIEGSTHPYLIIRTMKSYLTLSTYRELPWEYDWDEGDWAERFGDAVIGMELAERYTYKMFQEHFDEPKIVQLLRRQIFGWLNENL